ncbi:MAG: dipeptide/oligopeptide/nickel ABC transporter ATP-binding protein [Dehalococcoidia bacterium]|nr:dipeptide/oligopeptide/nickel ABC transporter ATP-binding protein [Dehalococcoidia bacterium]
MAQTPVLQVNNLKTHFFTRSGVVKAVDGVDFTLNAGETLGIVGESGSGKSMTALSIMGLVPQPAGKIVEGEILFNGDDLVKKTQAELQQIRGRDICMILQDPMTSLNPVFSVGNQVIETVKQSLAQTGETLKERAIELLHKVKIAAPESRIENFPHQMSGGMRQRVVGAIAIAGSPQILIADEATTSLDATIQYQYLELLKELQRDTGMAIIFITHDMGVVAKMCDRVAVMYAGKVAEIADVRDIFNNPQHPYTEALMKSVPNVEEDVEMLYAIEGQPPALDNLPAGCTFAPRCQYAFDKCEVQFPDIVQIGDDSNRHTATCWKLSEN